MANRLLDGFDHYETADMLRKWDYISADTLGVSSTYARHTPGQGCRVAGGFVTIGQGGIGKNLTSANTGWGYFGNSWKAATMPGAGYHVLHSVYDLAASGGMKLCTLIGADGTVHIGYITVNSSSTILTLLASSVAAGIVTAAATYYVESAFKIHSTQGGCSVRIDGDEVVSYSGNTVRSTGSNYHTDSSSQQFTHVRVGGDVSIASHPGIDIDDFYYNDDVGTRNNSFWGDTQIQTIYSNAPGDVGDWTRTGAASDILAVNEHPAIDDDTGYLAASVVGRQFLHNLDGLVSAVGSVASYAVNHMTRKDDSGSRQVKALAKIGGVVDTTGTPYATPSSYANKQMIFETSAATGAAPTLAEIAGLQTGAEVTT